MDLIKLIEQTAGISAYKVVTRETRTSELFYVGRLLETVRATHTTDTSVNVYVHHDDALGDSTFPVFASMDEGAVREALFLAVARAKLVSNRPYRLPQGENHFAIPSDLADLDPKEVAAKVAEAIASIDPGQGGSINALEIFVTAETTRVQGSDGLDKTQSGHRISIEAIPTQTDEAESVELYEWYETTALDLEGIKAEIADKLAEVKARKAAVKGEPRVIDVALRPDEIGQLVECLADELSYGAVYTHANAYDVGEDLQKDRTGDPLTVTLKAEVAGSRFSAAFDSDGMTLLDRTVIKDGKAVDLWGSTRYGQYLGKPQEEISGVLRCIAVEPGTLAKPQGDYLECVSMSGLQLDVYNDYIGGEIRLAYLHQGDKVTPVTGISMSAKLSEVLPSIRLSSAVTVRGRYQGPALALLKSVQIV